LPKVLRTNAKASKFVLPGNNGLPLINSGKIQPNAQISIDLSYILLPTNNSGARYQRVETYSVSYILL